LLAAAAGAAIYLIKFGIPLHRNRSKEERKLQVLEMRPLGNRQFLIVVGYEDTRMLLGVTPGKIDYLCPLDSISSTGKDFAQLVEESEKREPIHENAPDFPARNHEILPLFLFEVPLHRTRACHPDFISERTDSPAGTNSLPAVAEFPYRSGCSPCAHGPERSGSSIDQFPSRQR
jgi:flagellar biogenesis protein FliO